MNSLSKSEQEQLVCLLNKLEPGFLPAEIFYGLTRLVVTNTYTIVPLFHNNGLYVHLTYRDDKGPHWPSLLQTPGKVILPTDKSIEDVISRLHQDETKEFDILEGPIFCGYVLDTIPRGKEVAIINYVLLKTKPDFGELHSIKKLPKNLIPTEVKRIEMAVKNFRKKTN